MCQTDGLTEQSFWTFGSQRHCFLAPLGGRVVFFKADVSPSKVSHIAPAHGIAQVELKRPFHLSNSGLRLSDKIKEIADKHGRMSKIGVEMESNLSLRKPKFCFLSPYVYRSEAHMRECRTVVQRHRLSIRRKTLPQ